MPECHERGSESPVGSSQFQLQLKLLAAHLHVVCVGVRVHARVSGRVWRRGWVMGDLDVPNFNPDPISFLWIDAPQDATLLSW